MQDVARLAGVSVATVSFAINGTKPLTPATLARVNAAIAELDFQPNALARGLASKRTRLIALLLPSVERDIGPTEVSFIAAAAAALRERGHNLILWPAPHEYADEVGNLVRQGLVDGVLVMEVRLKDERVAVLQRTKTPFVLIGRTEDPSDLSYVDIDFIDTANQAVDHLVKAGHTSIALLGHSSAAYESGFGPTVRTTAAYRVAMTERGLTPVDSPCDDTSASGRRVLARWLSEVPDLTAVIAMNHRATFGIFAELAERGLRVPHDMSILSIMSSPEAADMTLPPSTTLSAPGAALARRAVEALVDQLSGQTAGLVQELIPCTFEVRDTTSRPARRR